VTVLTGSTSLAGTALAAFPGENGRLAFHSSMRAGNSDIFTVSPAGGTALNVTANPARDLDPAWSADGQRMAFSSDRTGDDEIYVREANGTLTQLTASPSRSSGHSSTARSAESSRRACGSGYPPLGALRAGVDGCSVVRRLERACRGPCGLIRSSRTLRFLPVRSHHGPGSSARWLEDPQTGVRT